MKTLPISFLFGTLLLASPAEAAQTAQMRVYCLSPVFDTGDPGFGGTLNYTLDLTTAAAVLNGELAPDFVSPSPVFSHYSTLWLHDVTLDEYVPGSLLLNIPPYVDLNDNGYDDFYEVSQSVGAITDGAFSFDLSGYDGTVEATWIRNAGSRYGTCVLSFYNGPFNLLFEFTHSFELIEYTGPISYTPGVSNVVAHFTLTQTGAPSLTLAGALNCTKSESDPGNVLTIEAGTVTNEVSEVFSYFESGLVRDATWPTNYYGYLDMLDGDLSTPDPDYLYWDCSIDDLNDSDGDGIPDFSDDVASAPPNPPVIAISLGSTEVWLTLTGDVGRLHEIESAESLNATNWTTVRSVTLTNSPQVESFPRPTDTAFWRARALP